MIFNMSTCGMLDFILLILPCIIVVAGQQQAFRNAPSNVTKIQGQSAVLECTVDNQKGDLQWTKDGFALGFDRSVPGFPRYQMIGSEVLGESNLFIINTDLEDDGEYQCQVGPGGGDSPLLGIAHLNVLIPPQTPTIEGYSNGSLVKVPHEQKTLDLTCVAENGKPAATIKWLRNGEDIGTSMPTQQSVQNLSNKLQNAKSILTITPKQEDNEALFTCQANSEALQEALETTVQLSVMYPPGKPEIQGYVRNQVFKTGDTVRLMCISRGGNPLPQVFWYRNDEIMDFSHLTKTGRVENELVITVQPTDNNARFRCEASNVVTPEPLKEEIQLEVHFAPEKVTIKGHQNAKAGDVIKLTCECSISNPPAKITWMAGGQQLQANSEEVVPSPEGGFITKSEISVKLTDRDDNVMYHCNAKHDEFGQIRTANVTLMVLYAPNPPTIAGYTEGKEVYKGSLQTLTCTCIGGNPPATLTWWKDGNAINQQSIIRKTGNFVTSQLTFLLDADDNQAEYTCNATNAAAAEPLLASVTLTVSFPPESLNITIRPKKARAGQTLTITCKSATSNPPSVLSWIHKGDEMQGIDGGTHPAQYGGTSTISHLEIIPKVEDHGEIYACKATNPLLSEAFSDAVMLDILFKPYFPPEVPTKLDVVEDLHAMLNVTALGNPAKLKYSWFRLNEKLKFGKLKREKRELSMPHFLQDGPLLNVTNVTKADAGIYVVQASNSEGDTNFTVTVNVLYAPTITKAPKKLLVDADVVASVYCEIDANPLELSMVEWSRAGYNMSRATPELSGQTAMLKIEDANKDDSGIFTCKVNNGIGDPVEDTAILLVKYAPEIDPSPAYSKAAAEKFASAELKCKAEGVPEITFKWYRGAQEVDFSAAKYETAYKQTGLVTYESILKVHNTTKADYDKYKCVAMNEVGMDERLIQLDGTSKPDPPFDLRFVNATHNSITIAWKAGFDGGSTQKFQVRYKELGVPEGDLKRQAYKYEDVVPSDSTVFTVTELKLATAYEMTVRGINRLGEGPFQPEVITVRSSVAPLMDDSTADDVPLIIILTVSILGMILLGLNVLLILFFIRRRRQNKGSGFGSESASQANSVEMYNPSNLQDDVRSYSTYDRKSIEGFRESPYYDMDDERRFFPNDSYDKDPYGSSHHGSMQFKPMAYQNHYSSNPQWKTSRDDLPRSVSLGPAPGETNDDEDYANQLRKMQQSITDPKLTGPVGDYGGRGRTPPPPPARSSSRHGLDAPYQQGPPIPSRNYDPVDIPRYGPAPGSSSGYDPYRYGSSTDMRGALV